MSSDLNPLDRIEKEVSDHQQKIDIQLEMKDRIAELIPEYGGNVEEARVMEFFFYADAETDAKALAKQLETSYHGKNIGIHFSHDKFCIMGQTEKKYIKSQPFETWIAQMNELAFSLDCEFDGWGSAV